MTAETNEFDFRNRVAEGPLSRLVSSIWYARGQIGYKREKIAPTGSTVAVIVLGAPILQTPDDGMGVTCSARHGLLIGPHVRPIVNEPTAETFAIGIVATPVGCKALFGVEPSHIRGRVVDLEASWDEAAALRTDLLSCGQPDDILNLLEAGLHQKPVPEDPAFRRCEQAVALLEGEPTRPIADIAAELGISHAHLDRELARIVGLSPRALARLLRLRRLLDGLDVNTPIDWADLANRFGWFDQAHFIRDFRRHTGVSPSRYVAAQRATYTAREAETAAGFVPES
ncbi:AraC family transcriptional regulator [Nitratireductor sp. XY-223]|uniref:helix-turn-helix domain-containing protein n=1 Tax=Nitratireductor sp. XY-223 TaxID=2561926 RepID=UPI0010A9C753|nr:AraC family transcriptional regulator [Nitratireductor sp. XY-223]